MTDWGNYQGYQGIGRHTTGLSPSSSHVSDPRLVLLTRCIPDFFKARRVLDIGCNAGSVTVQLGLHFEAASVTGVDIDESLIRRARSHLTLRCSRVMEEDLNYFPISAVLDYGHRYQHLDVDAAAVGRLPVHVNFVCDDWAVPDHDPSDHFDIILALSVVKWIHLEHFDNGLVTFFRKCTASLDPKGYLVLEVQPWKSYVNAVGPRKSSHFVNHLDQLQLRPESFTEILAQLGLDHVFTSNKLPRQITVYRKR